MEQKKARLKMEAACYQVASLFVGGTSLTIGYIMYGWLGVASYVGLFHALQIL